jgi:hypothetical protein
VYRVAALSRVQQYLKGLRANAADQWNTLPSGEAKCNGSKQSTVIWTHLNQTVGFGSPCFKTVHECSSHELKELPYSSGLVKMPPARPRIIEDGNQLIHTLGLREDNLHILRRIKSLDISNQRVHSLPERISMMHNLVEFDVSNNGLEVLPNQIGTMTTLTRLKLSENPALMRDFSSCLLTLTGLTELNLDNTGLMQITHTISVMRKLVLLDISSNQLLSLPRKELASMHSLTTLPCHGNPEVDGRICGIPSEVVWRPGTTTRVRDGDKHSSIPLSDTWNWSPDGVVGYLRHRPHMYMPIRKEEGKPDAGGWMRSNTKFLMESYGCTDKGTHLMDELLRLVIFLRRYPFPSMPGGPELHYCKEREDYKQDNSKTAKKNMKLKRKLKTASINIFVEKYYVADRIYDIWDQLLTPRHECVARGLPDEDHIVCSTLVSVMTNTTLLSIDLADLHRLFKMQQKLKMKQKVGFPFPPDYFVETPTTFPPKRDLKRPRTQTPISKSRPETAEARHHTDGNEEDGGEEHEEEAVHEDHKEETPEEEEHEEGEEGHRKLKAFNVWEFHGVMFLALVSLLQKLTHGCQSCARSLTIFF